MHTIGCMDQRYTMNVGEIWRQSFTVLKCHGIYVYKGAGGKNWIILRVGLSIVAQPGVESCLFCLFHLQPRQSLSWIFVVNTSWKATAFDYTARGRMVF